MIFTKRFLSGSRVNKAPIGLHEGFDDCSCAILLVLLKILRPSLLRSGSPEVDQTASLYRPSVLKKLLFLVWSMCDIVPDRQNHNVDIKRQVFRFHEVDDAIDGFCEDNL